jgi:hypothetical protein
MHNVIQFKICVDAASADQYVTFSPPFSFAFVYDIFSFVVGTLSSESVLRVAQRRHRQ